MNMEFKDKIMWPYFREVKCQQGYTAGIWYLVYVLGHHEFMLFSNSVSNLEYNFGGQGSFPEGANKKNAILIVRTFC